MLAEPVTEHMIGEWEALHLRYTDVIIPARKSGSELIAYLKNKYDLTPLDDEHMKAVACGNILNNASLREKLPPLTAPDPRVFFLENSGAGAELYRRQEDIFAWVHIIVYIDLASGVYGVEGSGLLWDELCAFQGLDEADIKNPFMVAQYVGSRKRLGLMIM